MPMMTVYLPNDVDAAVIRRELSKLAIQLGYVTEQGPSSGEGSIGRLLVGIAQGNVTVDRELGYEPERLYTRDELRAILPNLDDMVHIWRIGSSYTVGAAKTAQRIAIERDELADLMGTAESVRRQSRQG